MSIMCESRLSEVMGYLIVGGHNDYDTHREVCGSGALFSGHNDRVVTN